MTKEEKFRRMAFEEAVGIICDTDIFSDDDEYINELKAIVKEGNPEKIMKLYEAVFVGD